MSVPLEQYRRWEAEREILLGLIAETEGTPLASPEYEGLEKDICAMALRATREKLARIEQLLAENRPSDLEDRLIQISLGARYG